MQGKRKQAAQQEAPGDTSRHAKPALLLGHLCSVVTSVTCSPDGRFVATTDKDRKARVSCLPRDSQQVSFRHHVTGCQAHLCHTLLNPGQDCCPASQKLQFGSCPSRFV